MWFRFPGYDEPMKRPSESAISESDLRQRIVPLEQIVETTDGAHRRAGAGVGPPQGAIPSRSRLVALTLPPRRAPTLPSADPWGARRADSRARRARRLVGSGRAGGRTDRGQTEYLPRMRTLVDGTRSPSDATRKSSSRLVERLLTVRDTMRQQQRKVLDYLRRACNATVSQQPAPSLLPSTHFAIC